MKNRLEEIIVTAKKALAVTEKEIIALKVYDIDKKKNTYVSMGGCLDSIILLAEDILKDASLHEPHQDNMDHMEHHNIAGNNMNRPSRDQDYKK